MICLHCTQLDLRTHRDHAKVGMGVCKLEKLPGVFVTISYERDCKQFEPAPADVKAARDAWRKR